MKEKIENIIGRKYGKLTIVSDAGLRGSSWRFVNTLCECGNEKAIRLAAIVSRYTKSCGCLRRKHGSEGTRLYSIWHGMKSRCLNKKDKSYCRYGGRGTKICNERMNAACFIKGSMKSGYKDNLSIDRIDNSGDYCPENCRWSTDEEQANNMSSNIVIHAFGENKTMKQWSRDIRCVVQYQTLQYRISTSKWPAEKALTTFSMRKGNKNV